MENEKMLVQNMRSNQSNRVPNQFIITMNNGDEIFQSYSTIIAKRSNGKVYINTNHTPSVTTGKYRNKFLGENLPQTRKKIKSGEYILTDLNTKDYTDTNSFVKFSLKGI
jgi:hypothetical protein